MRTQRNPKIWYDVLFQFFPSPWLYFEIQSQGYVGCLLNYICLFVYKHVATWGICILMNPINSVKIEMFMLIKFSVFTFTVLTLCLYIYTWIVILLPCQKQLPEINFSTITLPWMSVWCLKKDLWILGKLKCHMWYLMEVSWSVLHCNHLIPPHQKGGFCFDCGLNPNLGVVL